MVALQVGPTEVCSIMLLGLLAGSTLARGSPLKGVAMTVFGLMLGIEGGPETVILPDVARYVRRQLVRAHSRHWPDDRIFRRILRRKRKYRRRLSGSATERSKAWLVPRPRHTPPSRAISFQLWALVFQAMPSWHGALTIHGHCTRASTHHPASGHFLGTDREASGSETSCL
jgi:hypothetical protein